MSLASWLGLKSVRPIPFLADEAIKEIDRFIASRQRPVRGLELGAGGSTLWLADRVDSLVSIEHAKNWYWAVRRALERRGKTNVVLRYIPRPYFYELERLPAGSFDLVLIDGRDRVESVRRACRLLAPGGLLILDDAQRLGTDEQPGRYHEARKILEGWNGTVHTDKSGGKVHGTVIWTLQS